MQDRGRPPCMGASLWVACLARTQRLRWRRTIGALARAPPSAFRFVGLKAVPAERLRGFASTPLTASRQHRASTVPLLTY